MCRTIEVIHYRGCKWFAMPVGMRNVKIESERIGELIMKEVKNINKTTES